MNFLQKNRIFRLTGDRGAGFLSQQYQNELDATRARVQNSQSMMHSERFRKSGSRCAAILGVASAMCLCSCWDKAADQAEDAPATKPMSVMEDYSVGGDEQAAPQDGDSLAAAREALFQHAVYTLGPKVTSPETFPQLNTTVKDMLELMRSYYAELQKGEPSLERARLALQIAATTRDLGAHAKAQAEYEAALAEVENLPTEDKLGAEGQRMLSACHNGVGVCLLAQGKASEALPKYEAALAVDEAQYQSVAPAEGEELPEGEVEPALSRAAADLLDSYRCLGDCQRAVEDPEEAATTYKKGHTLAQRLKRLSSDMSIAYVKLLTSMGNLDNSMGKSKDAMAAWVIAARICQSLNASSPKLEVKAETKRCFDALLPAIQSVGQGLQAEQEEAKKNSEEEKAAAEKAAAEAAAAEAAAAERLAAEQKAAEQKAAEEKAAAEAAAQNEANKRVRERRRR